MDIWKTVLGHATSQCIQHEDLRDYLHARVLRHHVLPDALADLLVSDLARLDEKLASLGGGFLQALKQPAIAEAAEADLVRIVRSDLAKPDALAVFLSFQGYHAVQCYRVAHAHWKAGRQTLAVLIQNWAAKLYGVDIHPAAQLGKGLFIDHALGVVIGETAVIEDDVCMLHGVTLGSTLKESGSRHPKVRRGATIGAQATILGNIEIGAGAMVAAGSVVRRPVPPGMIVAGVPARTIGPVERLH